MRDMKKFYLILLGVATLSFATLSCTKEAADPSQQEQSQKEENPKEDTTPENPTGEDDTPVPEGMVRLTFGVSHEGDAPATEPETEDSKTSWDGSTHAWSDHDQVRIIWGTGEKDYFDAEVVDGKVTATVGDAQYYYAVYPTTATYALDLDNEKLTITVPCYQTGSFSDANIMAAKTTKAAANLEFKNMTSIIKFTTGSTYSYNSVSFMANDQTILTGTVSTTFPSNKFAVETAVGTESIVCIQKGEPSENAGVSADNTYYLAMLPGAKIDDGIGFKIEECDTETKLIAGGLSKSAFYRERAKIYDMGTLDDRIVTNWYISEFGTGKGNDEANPAGPARLMDLLNPSYSTNNTTAGWRLTNATIHVAGGTYNLQELNGGEVFDPHYELSDSDLKVHVKGEGDASNPTKFICNQTADNDHIFSVTGSHRVGNFTFENITFTANPSASNTNSSGIAFNYAGSSNVENVVTFKDCTFDGLTSTASSGTYGGSAAFVSSNKSFDILFDGCTFKNNNAVRGAVALSNSGAESNVSFSGCTFSNNVSNGNQGGSIYVYANGKTTIDSSSFAGDGSTSTANNGGAIAIIAGATVTLQNGCSFTGCTTSGSGGAIFNHGTLIADGATFSGCKAKLGGAIHTDGAATIGETAGCKFSNNVATQNGGSIHFQKTNSGAASPTLAISNSSFSGNGETVNASEKGGAIAATSTAYEFTVSNCTFSNLVAAAGGAVHTIGVGTINNGSLFTACKATTDGGAIYNSGNLEVLANSFSENTASNGSAIYNAAGSTTKQVKAIIFNSSFVSNVAAAGKASTGAPGGGCISGDNYDSVLIANSTFKDNLCKAGGVLVMNNSTNNNLYVVSSTVSGSQPAITRTHGIIRVFNSLMPGSGSGTTTNIGIDFSVYKGSTIDVYGASTANGIHWAKHTIDGYTNIGFGLGSFSKGVFPLDENYESAYTQGMTTAQIEKLTFSNIDLTDDQQTLLGKDQMGNDRGDSKIMGAYVLTTDPTE